MISPYPLPTGLPGIATFFVTPDGLVRLGIATHLSTAALTLNGAHVTHFQPHGASPLLFVSGSSHLTPGRPIRGGVPVCFPWFGARAGDPQAPAHGFARTTQWAVESVTGSEETGVTAVLILTSTEATRAFWPHDFTARLRVEVTRELRLTLEVENPGPAPFLFEEALHTYFAISDVNDVTVTGLEGAAYLDKVAAGARQELGPDPLRFTGETDRIFPANTATCTIHDPGFPRRIVIEKTGSHSTVVWNPWIAKAAAMADFGDREWPQMLCIETANVGTDAITLAPGARHEMTALIRLG